MPVTRLWSALLTTAALSCTSAAQVQPVPPPPAPSHGASQAAAPRAECDSVANRLCQDLGPSPACEAVRARTPTLAISDCIEIREHYPNVLADLKKMNQRFEPLPVAIADAIAVPGAPGLGNSSAPIQRLVFWDYECPYCAKAFTALEQVQQRFPNEVRVAVAQYPLPLHPHAALAAEAALSAHAQGRFWAFSQAAFAHQEALERADLLLYAAQAKLDPTKFAKNLDAHEYASAVQREAALGDQAHVAGTPTLYVNRQPCSIPITLEGVTACVDTARKAASSRPSP